MEEFHSLFCQDIFYEKMSEKNVNLAICLLFWDCSLYSFKFMRLIKYLNFYISFRKVYTRFTLLHLTFISYTAIVCKRSSITDKRAFFFKMKRIEHWNKIWMIQWSQEKCCRKFENMSKNQNCKLFLVNDIYRKNTL